MTESFTSGSLPWGRAKAGGYEERWQPEFFYYWWIVYLSSHLVITVIMVWRV
jgi:hypothetical protein